MEPILLPNGIELASLDARQARVRMLSPLAAANVRPDEQLAERLKAAGLVSQWSQQSKNDNFDFASIDDVMPQEGDYISVDFRAISKTVIPGHWIDWTRDNVLEESVGLLLGATVYPNHSYYDINGWLGAVSNVEWDADGKAASGVAGINARYKIDALMNPRIARGLMMEPPAIHSTSMTVLFEFEYSHPEMAAEDRWKFFRNLGEEIDGEIVRLIVTKINEYWEASLVFQGADRLAKMQPKDDTANSFSAEAETAADQLPPNSTDEEKTMKLTSELKAKLGIEFDGDEVPDEQVSAAIDSLSAKAGQVPDNLTELNAQAEAGKKFIEKQRDEVTRLAKLAECDEGETELPSVIAEDIKAASFDRLVDLESFYDKKVAAKFGNGRSSAEDSKKVEDAGGTSAEAKDADLPKVSLL